MRYNREIHHRRSIRLTEYDYSQAGAYFVTICSWSRECLFGNIVNGGVVLNEYGKIVEEYIGRIKKRFDNVCIENYVIMPNHVHMIISISQSVGIIHELSLQTSFAERCKQRRKMLLPKIIGWFKMNSAKSINQLRDSEGRPVWQGNYYEHVIRNEKEMISIREYIINNPMQWELDENNPVNIK